MRGGPNHRTQIFANLGEFDAVLPLLQISDVIPDPFMPPHFSIIIGIISMLKYKNERRRAGGKRREENVESAAQNRA